MKTKSICYALALCGAAYAGCGSAQAQDVFVNDAISTEVDCDNTNHYFANWRNNWFIELSAGANTAMMERGMASPAYAKHSWEPEKFTAAYSVGFGRWLTPSIALRFKGMYGAIHWDDPLNPEEALAGNGWSRMKHAGINVQMMWDMFNTFGGYNPDRVFAIVPFFGIGGDASWDFKDKENKQPGASNVLRDHADKYKNPYKNVEWTLPASAGLQFRFRLCKYLDFFAEASVTFYGDCWNNYAVGNCFDMLFSAMGGLNINLGGADGGGRSWKSFNECDYVKQIADLNDQVNGLRSQLLDCGKQVANLQAQLPCPEVVQKDCKNAPLMATVRFLLNSYKIIPTEEISIYTMAEWLKANPEEKIIIAGYADRNTGTPEYNLQLSQKRADAVKNALVNDYGIDPSRLSTTWFGSDVQEYPSHNDWNRIVIFKQ